jgi:hypothetical protein
MVVIGFLVPPIWLAGFFWDAKPGSAWDRRNGTPSSTDDLSAPCKPTSSAGNLVLQRVTVSPRTRSTLSG